MPDRSAASPICIKTAGLFYFYVIPFKNFPVLFFLLNEYPFKSKLPAIKLTDIKMGDNCSRETVPQISG